jgi:hypothetical protein
MDEVFSTQPDLTNQLIGNWDVEYFTDGSSFARYAVVTLDSVFEASAQKAELVTLTWALQLAAGV